MKKIIFSICCLIFPFLTFAQEEMSVGESINAAFEKYTTPIVDTIMYPIVIAGKELPIVILILLLGALFFTIYFKGVNLRYFKDSIKTAWGKYDDLDHYVPADEEITVEDGKVKDTVKLTGEVQGEVTHFQALTASLSATVGLGNIAGVAVAIALGGPGATIWMIIAGLLGMASKFVECTLGVKYREVDENGKTYGGPMYYLSKGLKEKGLGGLGKVAAVVFAIFCIGGSFGGGNMFQSNQASSQLIQMTGWDNPNAGLYLGLIMAVIIGLVIIGGIKRIGSFTEKVVPFMAIVYVLAGFIIIAINIDMVGYALGQIWDGAMNPNAAFGGVVGVIIVGFQRAAFSNEAGVGSAAIAHSAVKTRYPASEGLTASIGPFVDTVIICTMTAIVIIITNAKHNLFTYGNLDAASNVMLNATNEPINGVDLTSVAFDSAIPYFSIVLTIAVVLFAISTAISWSYYGLQSWKYLFGKGKVQDITYKILFLIFVVVGASSSLGAVIAFSDAMIFAMVFPNIIGLVLLSPKVRKELQAYLNAIKIGKMDAGIDKASKKTKEAS
ncbi:alanine/glycine:cation symporter family protein [Leeuwenhoekiella marinoflava]|uniref:AGCS family alanine or glycine:cation symporter n=2 Tax=Leeuwenhoekiella marinoflava TaxID=988 RepID=A0A4V1KS26_9FLAO|nr:alanine/glycine:cation symporter family protein [Leeuwenhoekiella marinoflava]RXG27063.1 AGCS family alanine or glycine:cation symporter [Leeuwenhoekiella marinoflava]SHF43357.1 alanine or glycine:cation symporter, AGCS family [Leeuwenhoekiella marinoflava DSM 3653]